MAIESIQRFQFNADSPTRKFISVNNPQILRDPFAIVACGRGTFTFSGLPELLYSPNNFLFASILARTQYINLDPSSLFVYTRKMGHNENEFRSLSYANESCVLTNCTEKL